MPAEIEATVVICHDDPERIATDIDGLVVLGFYRFSRSTRTTIEDVYFDTPDRLLKGSGWALRIRTTENVRFVAAKGPGLRSSDGVAARSELEIPWSREGLSRVWHEVPPLRQQRIAEARFESDPVQSLEKAGLVQIHRRTTRRHTGDLLDLPFGDPCAELAVDRVTYRFPFGPILHWEVEIEAKGRGNSATVSAIMESLLQIYGPSLRRWDYGKLATGSAVEQLMARGSIQNRIGHDRRLLPGAYDLIDALLRRGKYVGTNGASMEDCCVGESSEKT